MEDRKTLIKCGSLYLFLQVKSNGPVRGDLRNKSLYIYLIFYRNEPLILVIGIINK